MSALAGGGLLGGAVPGAAAPPSPEQDERILSFALGLEYLQAAFYADAEARGALDGELATFSRVVGEQERRHVEHLRRRLGSAAGDEPEFDFGEITSDPDRFREAAVALEEAGVGAYVGQGANLTVAGIEAVAPLVSVEARHAAWIRAVAARNPAPAAADPGRSVAEVREMLAAANLALPEGGA